VQATEGERSAQRQQAAGASDRRGAQCPAPAGGGCIASSKKQICVSKSVSIRM